LKVVISSDLGGDNVCISGVGRVEAGKSAVNENGRGRGSEGELERILSSESSVSVSIEVLEGIGQHSALEFSHTFKHGVSSGHVDADCIGGSEREAGVGICSFKSLSR
jgi:hypothetical protein